MMLTVSASSVGIIFPPSHPELILHVERVTLPEGFDGESIDV